ncbi:MAG: flagellar hook-associated family protein [Proteobacteria bacterium]|nr:flagellar hook-associated family protein [Pseudomonadota bacterium]
MSSSFISTAAIFSPTRDAVLKLQLELAKSQKEVSTGKHADIGLSIGSENTNLSKLFQAQAWQEALSNSNAVAATRLDASQSALSGMASAAQTFVDQVIAGQSAPVAISGIIATAKNGLSALTSQSNTQVAGVYVFAGDNSDRAPMADFAAPGSSASAAIDTAFTAAFGIPPTDPGVSAITPDQMQQFLDGPFAASFSDAGWSADWSSASSSNAQMRVADNTTIDVGANTNETAFRNLAQAYVMITSIGADKLAAATMKVVLDKAAGLASTAIDGLSAIQSRLGSAQASITSANEDLSAQGNIIAKQVAQLQEVDPYAASTSVSTLMTQLQASYQITAQLQKMSLLNYL